MNQQIEREDLEFNEQWLLHLRDECDLENCVFCQEDLNESL